jgi:hypothetical protein
LPAWAGGGFDCANPGLDSIVPEKTRPRSRAAEARTGLGFMTVSLTAKILVGVFSSPVFGRRRQL